VNNQNPKVSQYKQYGGFNKPLFWEIPGQAAFGRFEKKRFNSGWLCEKRYSIANFLMPHRLVSKQILLDIESRERAAVPYIVGRAEKFLYVVV
jgi:hypothetical protein